MMDSLVHHMLRTTAGRLPDKEAVVHGAQRLTYADVWTKASNLAHALRREGVNRGDRVGIYLECSVSQVLAIFGISQAEATFVPINTQLFPDQVAHIVNDCEMKALITSQRRLEGLSAILPQLKSLQFIVVRDYGSLPSLPLPFYSLESMCASERSSSFREHSISKDPAAILYTSGSTGKPKGVVLSHANVMAGATIVSTYLRITEKERILAVLPFSFDAGLNQLTTAVQQGGTVVLINFVFARDVVQMLLKERITGLAGVPTFWSILTQPNSTLTKQAFPDLRYITNTGGAMPQNVLKQLREVLPTTEIFLMYGLTEAFRSTYLPPEELDRRPTSIGKAIPDTEILVVTDDGRPCKPGEVGELVHRGPTVALGYWGRPEETARVLRPNPGMPSELGDCEKVCYSGDLVKMDENGFLYFIGRRDTMIKSSGFRISPTEVEEAIFSSGNVQHAAVIGIPDEVLGHKIKAFIVTRNGDPVNTEDIVEHCGNKLPRYMVPKAIEVLSEMPRTSSGKVDYPALRRREGIS
jgi:acyl-CoA ligase (AMP-forming) (exosortase A-associated)